MLYQAIVKEICLSITYQAFKARQASTLTFHPFILKECNNRWFVVGKKDQTSPILTLALDRIQKIEVDLSTPYIQEDFNGEKYYQNTIGVTVLSERHLKEIVLKIDRSNAPYVLTKPFHTSQQVLEKLPDGSILIQLYIHINYELERLILGFGESIEVIKPRILRSSIRRKLQKALEGYV